MKSFDDRLDKLAKELKKKPGPGKKINAPPEKPRSKNDQAAASTDKDFKETDAHSAPESGSAARPGSDSGPGSNPEAVADSGPKFGSDSGQGSSSGSDSDSDQSLGPDPTPDPGPDSTPDPTSDPGPDSTPDPTPDPGPDSTPASTPDPGPDSTSDSTPDPGPDSTSDSGSDIGSGSSPDSDRSAVDSAAASEQPMSTGKALVPKNPMQPRAAQVEEQGPVNARLVCLLEPRSEHAESYYRLRYHLETRRRADSALVVGVTSPSEGDGKTLTGINLAGALAKDSRARVLLLDLDLRRDGDGLSEYLGMTNAKEIGVVDWIRAEGFSEAQLTYYLDPFNLHVMTAGGEPELPYELLKSTRLDELIERARQRFDFIIVDTPQILRLPDTELISRLVDGFLIVVKADQTRQVKLEEALNLMAEEKVFGLVFNSVTENQ